MSVSESPPAPASRSRTLMACMAVSSVVRMSGFLLCGEDARIRAHRSSGLRGRQGLSPHGGRYCLGVSTLPPPIQARSPRPASLWIGTRGPAHARTPHTTQTLLYGWGTQFGVTQPDKPGSVGIAGIVGGLMLVAAGVLGAVGNATDRATSDLASNQGISLPLSRGLGSVAL